MACGFQIRDKKTSGLQIQKSEGTTLKGRSNKTNGQIYSLLKEIEYTNRVLKTDLKMRPIYHITDEHKESHFFLGILAYRLA